MTNIINEMVQVSQCSMEKNDLEWEGVPIKALSVTIGDIRYGLHCFFLNSSMLGTHLVRKIMASIYGTPEFTPSNILREVRLPKLGSALLGPLTEERAL